MEISPLTPSQIPTGSYTEVQQPVEPESEQVLVSDSQTVSDSSTTNYDTESGQNVDFLA